MASACLLGKLAARLDAGEAHCVVCTLLVASHRCNPWPLPPPDDEKSIKAKAKEGALSKKGAIKPVKHLTLAQKANKVLFGWLDTKVKVRRENRGEVR